MLKYLYFFLVCQAQKIRIIENICGKDEYTVCASLPSFPLWCRRGDLFVGRKKEERRQKNRGKHKFHHDFTLPFH